MPILTYPSWIGPSWELPGDRRGQELPPSTRTVLVVCTTSESHPPVETGLDGAAGESSIEKTGLIADLKLLLALSPLVFLSPSAVLAHPLEFLTT